MSNWDASDEDDPSYRTSNVSVSSSLDSSTTRRSDAHADTGTPIRSSGTTTFCVQSEKDATDAQKVCDALGIELHRVSFAAEYWTGVFDPFVEAVADGRMPNPDGTYVRGCEVLFVRSGVVPLYI